MYLAAVDSSCPMYGAAFLLSPHVHSYVSEIGVYWDISRILM